MKKAVTFHFCATLVLFIFLSVTARAQSRTITGVVQESISNNALTGATIAVKNSKVNTISKENGSFEITIPNGKVSLVVSFVGYETKTVPVGEGETSILVNLNQSAGNQLTDVVIVGVQKQTKRTTTSAISSVLSDEIENLPAPSVDQLLQGRVAGLNVQVTSGEPGVAPTIVVRGNSKVSTDIGDQNVAEAQALGGPLYVIDGIPTNPDDISNSLGATGTNFLAGININDIASVDVQKDATATAAWGSRGANGVVYITTKRGRSATPEFRVNIYGGITQQPALLQTAVGARERAQKMEIINQYATPNDLRNIPQILTDRFNPSFNNATDWQGLFYKPGSVKNVDATVSAATDNVNYRVSLNYYDEKGIIEAFGFTRYSLRGNFDFKINEKLNSQFIVAYSKSDRQRGRKYANNSDDNTPVSGSSQPSSLYRLTGFDSLNFNGLYDKLRNKNINDYFTGSLTLNYDILKKLKYTFQGAANVTTSNRDYFQPSNINEVAALEPGAAAQPSYALSDKGTFSTYFLSNTLNFNKKFTTANDHEHNIIVTGAQQFSADVSNTSFIEGYNVPSNNIQVVSGIPQSDINGESSYGASAILSLMAQVQYDFDRKYLLYGSYRGDASSRFGEKSKWGYFPAVGAGWVISDEKFMAKIENVVSFLKLRGTYGLSGNQSPFFYAPFNSYIIPGTYNGGIAVQPSYNNGLTKNNLTWSKTIQKNIGFDARLFNSKVNLTIDVYDKLSKDDIMIFSFLFIPDSEALILMQATFG